MRKKITPGLRSSTTFFLIPLVTGKAKKHYSRVPIILHLRQKSFDFFYKIFLFFLPHQRRMYFGEIEENLSDSSKYFVIYSIERLQCDEKVIHHSSHGSTECVYRISDS